MPAGDHSRVTHHNVNVLRLQGGVLSWYAPGSGDQPLPVHGPEDRERLRAALAEPRGALVFAVPGELVRLQPLRLSPEERRHLPGSLLYMLEEQLAVDIDTQHVAHSTLGPDQLLAMVCAEQRMQQWTELLVEHNPRYWVPEPLLLPWREGHWCLLIERGRALLRYGRAEGLAIETEALPALLNALLAEREPPLGLAIYGSDQSEDLALLPEPLGRSAQWRRGGFGSAMLLQDAAPAALPNLRQGAFAARLPLQRWWSQWRTAAVLACCAVLLQLLAMWAHNRELAQHNLALRAAIEASYREAVPQGALVDPERQLRQQLAALGGGSGDGRFVALLEQVGSALATQPGARLSSVNYTQRGGDMRLALVAADFAAVEAVRAALERSGLRATLENSSTSGTEVRARLRLERRA